jgi:hypothetical protein
VQLQRRNEKIRHYLGRDSLQGLHADPNAKVPGTRMTFAGIKKESEVSKLWGYLKQFDATDERKQELCCRCRALNHHTSLRGHGSLNQ